jgi:CRP/FNR family transcriptional regulator, cyclic AMP receptor protein
MEFKMVEIKTEDFFPEMNLLDSLNPIAFQKFISIAKRQTAEAGSALLREGSQGEYLYVILDGKFKVFKTGDNLEQIELAILNSGSTFGEMAVFDGQPSSATVIASEDSIILEISRRDLFEFIQKNHDIGLQLMHAMIYILSSRLRKANAHASSVASTNPMLSETLVELLQRHKNT